MVSISKEQVFKGAGLLLVGAASYWALNKFCGKRWKVLQHPACKVGVIATPLVLGMVYSNKKGFVAKLEDEILNYKGKDLYKKKVDSYTISGSPTTYIIEGSLTLDSKIDKTAVQYLYFNCSKNASRSHFKYFITLGEEYRNETARALCEKTVSFLMKRNLTFTMFNMRRMGNEPTRRKEIGIYQRMSERKDAFWRTLIKDLTAEVGIPENQIATNNNKS